MRSGRPQRAEPVPQPDSYLSHIRATVPPRPCAARWCPGVSSEGPEKETSHESTKQDAEARRCRGARPRRLCRRPGLVLDGIPLGLAECCADGLGREWALL